MLVNILFGDCILYNHVSSHHDCPLPVLSLREDERTGGVEHLVVHLLHFSGQTMQEGPVWFGHTSCL